MKVLLFMGSPRFGGNTDLLSDAFIRGCEEAGASPEKIFLAAKRITPCIECGHCEKEGACALKDDMTEIYQKINESQVIVLATPIFFYNLSSWCQALIERSQAMWVKKYILKHTFESDIKKGILIAVGATKGKKLFDGVTLVTKYFFDAISARFTATLLIRGIEKKGEILKQPEYLESARLLGYFLCKGEDIKNIPHVGIV